MGANNESESSPHRMDLKSALISVLFVILCCVGITTLFPFSDSSEMSGTSVAKKADIDGVDESGTRLPKNTPTPSPIATPQVLPLRINSPEWSFTIKEVELRNQVKDGNRTIEPENDAFLILLGELGNHTSERECIYSSDWSLENTDTGEEYRFDHSISDAVKEIHGGLDYPGSFLGICVDGNDSRRTFVGFDVPQNTSLVLNFLKNENGPSVPIDSAISLAGRPTVTPTPTVIKESTKPTNQVPTETPTIESTESTEKIASETHISVDPIGYVKVTTNANLRAGPGVENEVVGGATVGDMLPVFARTEDGWFMVDYVERKWIGSTLVELDFALAEIPFADDIPQVTPVSARQMDLGTEESNTEMAPPAGVEIGETWVRPKDGQFMVYVPAGSFSMGGMGVFEQPVHEVSLDGYWMDEAEITNAQFAVFVSDTNYKTSAEQSGESRVIYSEENWDYEDGADWRHPLGPGSSLDGKKTHPVVHVSWEDAESYCSWADARLPTEAEWEYAARGPKRLNFPWGNSFDTSKLNFCDVNCPDDYYRDETANDGYAFTSPVGTYPQGASWAGALDMAGNVSEWVNDWFDDEYYANSPIHNPQGPNSGEAKVNRGGGWDMDYQFLESHLRFFAGDEDSTNVLGFRCAIDATVTGSGPTANQVIEVPTEIPVEDVRSLGVEREDFFDVYKRLGFAFEEINNIDGQPRMMGTSPDGLAFVELYGPADELIKVTLVAGLSQENLEVSSAFVQEFLDITVPEWDKGVDWVIQNVELASRKSEVSTTYGDRQIRLSIVPDLGILTLVVEATGENPLTMAEP